jgi:hypothetical protein
LKIKKRIRYFVQHYEGLRRLDREFTTGAQRRVIFPWPGAPLFSGIGLRPVKRASLLI